jgi:hypothetical protein
MLTFKSICRRPANQPKPNTRFLNNIIRDTNSHNRALLAKEAADSKARLRELEGAEQRKREAEQERLRRLRPGASDTRKRMLGDIAAIIGGSSKRRKVDDGRLVSHSQKDDKRRRSKQPDVVAEQDKTAGREDEAHHSSHHHQHRNSRKELFADDDGKSLRSHRKHRERETSGSRERTYRKDESSPSRINRNDRDRHRHGRSSRTDSNWVPPHKRGQDRSSSKSEKQEDSTSELRLERPESSASNDGQTSDSDPLEEFIGPSLPNASQPIRRRGRGATKTTSGIDSRFNSEYDPKADVSVDEDDDWGTALEALRDRQKWKEQGADRLRAAGFTEVEVKKWEKGDQESEQDVHWTKKGEEREWDRGKGLTKFRDGTAD